MVRAGLYLSRKVTTFNMHRLSITSVIHLVAIAVFVNNAYASSIRGFHVRAKPAQSSPPSPSATGGFIAGMKNLLPTGSGPEKFSSLKHFTIGYGLTEYENGVEAPLSRISVIVDGIKDQPRFKNDIFLVSIPNYTFKECMVYTSSHGMKKFKSLPLIYEKKEIDSPPPAYERQQSSSQTGTPSVQKQLITFFAAKLSSETATTTYNVIVMRIDESHVKEAMELDLRTHCLKKVFAGEKTPATNLLRLWSVAEWDRYGVKDWPSRTTSYSDPGEVTIQLRRKARRSPTFDAPDSRCICRGSEYIYSTSIMAELGDFLALIATIVIFAGIVYAVYTVVGSVSEGVKSTKDKLKEKGYEISDKGMSVKTSKRMNREDYVDATQRGLIRAMGASSFGTNSNGTVQSPASTSPSAASASLSAPTLKHRSSSSSINSTSSGKKTSLFGKKRHD
ncbi:hypothetical protein J3R30DRAFT_3409782 [Lentinula aciculospora]|uniref:Uncharacterized protein n=1 Tax=Lentinula aciculospora TaxID=153920 RepID=A0A9W8ZX24_9AGAR|nr:hypothetical protein J3R30DRAFT_3409782 [Lentinula aciculospora]